MNLCRLPYVRLIVLIVVWTVVPSVAIGQTLPSGKSSSSPVGSRPAAVKNQAPVERLALLLPDDGPRLEGQSTGIDGLAWQEGQSAYKKQAWAEAQRFFAKIVTDYPESPLVPSAKAFLIELALREDSSGQGRALGIQEYKKLVRDHPQSINARRAEWRIGDLYFEQGWYQEAQVFYEQAMAHAESRHFDGPRSLLGLGYAYMAMGKWSEAEHAFSNVRTRTEHEPLLQGATLGMAHALYRQQRYADAQPLFDLAYRRWPRLVKADPLALQRFAVTEIRLQHEASARELLLLLYNLYPRHEHTPAALLQLAESLRAGANQRLAEFVYALLPALYPYSVPATTAKLRLAVQQTEMMQTGGVESLGRTVSAMMHDVPTPFQSAASYRSLLEDIATREAANPAGSEALFYLAKAAEQSNDMHRAIGLYRDITLKTGQVNDPWAAKAVDRLAVLLTPWIEAAIASQDDLTVVSLFHRHGSVARQRYARSPLLLQIADAHRRLGFAAEGSSLYQQVIKVHNDPALIEPALIGLGKIYLDQRDPDAARKVFERYRFQFPLGTYEGEVVLLLVQAMRQQRDMQGLLHLCRTWLLRHPGHRERPAMYLQLAKTLGELDKLEESALAYEEGFKAGAVASSETLLAYADTLSRLNRHKRAIAVYQSVLEKKPKVRQAEWARLQTAQHWTALKQYDRATVALAELGRADDEMVNRLSASLKEAVQTIRQSGKAEGL
ncbi:MAG: tetratricopeptide repeat protein [Nitrospira sp.]|nr:tetratricopeptide repeat protein [Nitrospira sp.]